jgi:hypothetical protein
VSQLQQQQVLRGLKVLLRGVAVLGQLSLPALDLVQGTEPAAAAAAAGGGGGDEGAAAAGDGDGDGEEGGGTVEDTGVVLPAQLPPQGTFGAAWQLPASCYSHLLLQPPEAGAATAARDRGQGTSAAAAAAGLLGAVGSSGVGGRGSKRARVLKDGVLTMIPYGQTEAELWGKRVHGFLGAVR